MAVVVVVHIGVALVVVHIRVALVVVHIRVALVVVRIWVALVVVNWSGLRLNLGSTALLILFVVGQWVIEGRKSGLSWAVSRRPGPLVLNGLGQAADDRSTLVGDG